MAASRSGLLDGLFGGSGAMEMDEPEAVVEEEMSNGVGSDDQETEENRQTDLKEGASDPETEDTTEKAPDEKGSEGNAVSGEASAGEPKEEETPDGSAGEGEGSAPQEQQTIEQKGLEALSGSMIFGSGDDLSDYLGFDMNGEYFEHVCTELGMGDPQYTAYPDGVGEITYTDGVKLNYFRKAEGQRNISGTTDSDTEYRTSIEFDGIERSGSLDGDRADHYLEASWTTIDGFSYSCYISEGLSQSEWYDMIDTLSKGDGNK
jgi:hypothetical protein